VYQSFFPFLFKRFILPRFSKKIISKDLSFDAKGMGFSFNKGFYLSHVSFESNNKLLFKAKRVYFELNSRNTREIKVVNAILTENFISYFASLSKKRSSSYYELKALNSDFNFLDKRVIEIPYLRVLSERDRKIIEIFSKNLTLCFLNKDGEGTIFIEKGRNLIAGSFYYLDNSIYPVRKIPRGLPRGRIYPFWLRREFNIPPELSNGIYYFKGEMKFLKNHYPIRMSLVKDKEGLKIEKILFANTLISGNIRRKKDLLGKFFVSGNNFKANVKFILKKRNSDYDGEIAFNKLYFKEHSLITRLYFSFLSGEGKIKIDSSGTVIDNKPCSEIKALISLKNGIEVKNFTYGKSLNLSASFKKPKVISLSTRLLDFDSNLFLSLLFPSLSNKLHLGKISGELQVFNMGLNTVTFLHLNASPGFIGDLKYDKGKIYLMGNGKILNFYNSELTLDNKIWLLDGKINLVKFPSMDMFSEIYLSPTTELVFWDKAYYEGEKGENKFYSLTTRLKDYLSFNYNVRLEDDFYKQGEFSIEYGKKEDDAKLRLRFRNEEEIMGIEKNIKF
jgi:hypothetical protein